MESPDVDNRIIRAVVRRHEKFIAQHRQYGYEPAPLYLYKQDQAAALVAGVAEELADAGLIPRRISDIPRNQKRLLRIWRAVMALTD